MSKKQLTVEEKRLDLDLMIIGIVTFLVFGLLHYMQNKLTVLFQMKI